MKTLIDITAKATTADWPETRGTLQSVHVEVEPGCFVHVGLGHAGLTIHHGPTRVGIPMEAIVALAQVHEPSLQPQQVAATEARATADRAEQLKRESMARKLAARSPQPSTLNPEP